MTGRHATPVPEQVVFPAAEARIAVTIAAGSRSLPTSTQTSSEQGYATIGIRIARDGEGPETLPSVACERRRPGRLRLGDHVHKHHVRPRGVLADQLAHGRWPRRTTAWPVSACGGLPA
ncbi:MAG: hypothetical protein ACM3ML_11580 [Micromonosporaceae bacterium]